MIGVLHKWDLNYYETEVNSLVYFFIFWKLSHIVVLQVKYVEDSLVEHFTWEKSNVFARNPAITTSTACNIDFYAVERLGRVWKSLISV